MFLRESAIIGLSSITVPRLIESSGMFSYESNRKVHRILSSSHVKVGTLPVMRAFAGDHIDYVSPYVLIDEFGPVRIEAGSDPLKVDAHPHAGVTPTTYLLSGSGHHKDSLNYDFQIAQGDFMMFSSGRGAIHMEESGEDLKTKGGINHGFQIWLNTPSKYEFADPSTGIYDIKQMNEIQTSDYYLKTVLGRFGDIHSDITTVSPAFYYHVKLRENGRIDIPVDAMDNAFLYLINGELEVEGQKKITEHQVVLYERGDTNINLYSPCGAELLVLGGQPLNEPVYSYGPFVMNNEEQINLCIQNYRNGKMGNPAIVNR